MQTRQQRQEQQGQRQMERMCYYSCHVRSQQMFFLLSLTGMYLLLGATAPVTSAKEFSTAAFAGSHRNRHGHNSIVSYFAAPPVRVASRDRRTLPVSPLVALFGTTSTTSSSADPQESTIQLLEGKLTVLQEVVKEMDARHRILREESKSSESDYQQKLEGLQRDLEESIAVSASKESAIGDLRQSLAETQVKHAREIEDLRSSNNETTESGLKGLSTAHEKALEELQNDHQTTIDRLNEDLAAKVAKIEEISGKWMAAEEKATRIQSQNEILIEELRAEIEKQLKELAEIATQQQERESSSSKEKEKKDEIDISKQLQEAAAKAAAEATAAAKAVSEKKISVLRAEWEAEQASVLQSHEAATEALFSEKEGLLSELSELQKSRDEQIQIATASVKAGESREASLRSEVGDLKESLKQQKLLVKVANLVSDKIDRDNKRLSEENEELSETNKSLTEELEDVRSELDECRKMRRTDRKQMQQLQLQKQNSSVLGKLRSFWSRR